MVVGMFVTIATCCHTVAYQRQIFYATQQYFTTWQRLNTTLFYFRWYWRQQTLDLAICMYIRYFELNTLHCDVPLCIFSVRFFPLFNTLHYDIRVGFPCYSIVLKQALGVGLLVTAIHSFLFSVLRQRRSQLMCDVMRKMIFIVTAAA